MRLNSFVDFFGLWARLAVVGWAFGGSDMGKPGVWLWSRAVLCKIRHPNTMIYGVLKIAQNRLILCTPMKMSKWKGAIELPSRTFLIILDFSREYEGNAFTNLQFVI